MVVAAAIIMHSRAYNLIKAIKTVALGIEIAMRTCGKRWAEIYRVEVIGTHMVTSTRWTIIPKQSWVITILVGH